MREAFEVQGFRILKGSCDGLGDGGAEGYVTLSLVELDS